MVQYDSYKPSGANWLGDIPSSWIVRPLKYIFTIQKRIAGQQGHPVLSITQSGIKPKDMSSQGQFAEDYSNYQLVYPGDFAMNHMDLLTGWVDISKYEGVTSPDYRVFTNKNTTDYLSEYYNYILQHCYSNKVFYGLGQGVAGFGRWRLPADMFLNFKLPVPTRTEQTAIIKFLNDKVYRINSIISEAKASIEEYKAWKASIIYEAVTKGLNPNVETKDSGIDFIGEIPAHWKLTNLKRVCKRISDGSHFSPETTLTGFPYVTASDIRGKGIDFSSCRTISEESYLGLVKAGCQPSMGDVLMVKDGATTGRIGMMIDNTPCVLLSSVAMLTPNEWVDGNYLMQLIESEAVQFQIRKSMAGSAMPRTTLTKLMSYIVIDCPLEEQHAISKFLDDKCGAIDSIIVEKESLVSDLESYKKSLIFEVVTGKRKVVQS